MTVFEYRGRLLVVDCGVLFPDPDQPGVDLILPDFGYLEWRLDKVEAVVLTHAHEDHIGAVPYLLRERKDIPLAGSKLTLALVRSKLAEHRLDPVQASLQVAEVRQDEVHARLVRIGEQHTAVHDEQPAAVLEDRHVPADLAEPAERDDAKAVAAQGAGQR